MLIRLMMIVFLLAATMMPAWAGEKASAPSESSSAPVAEQMTMEEALAKVTIKAEDRHDGDMYHIRYTFTNPTDVAIEKEVAYTDIQYTTYPAVDPSDSMIPHYCPTDIHQYSGSISALTIPANASSSVTVSFPRKVDSPMILPNNVVFYFTDHTELRCERARQRALAAVILDGGEEETAQLRVKNLSSETITKIKDVAVYVELRQSADRTKKIRLHYVDAAPISLQLKPQEQTYVFLPDMPMFSNNNYLPDTSITMTINGVPHQFNVYYGGRTVDVFSYSDHWRSVYIFDHGAPAFVADENFIRSDASYEIVDSTVYVYLRIQNPQPHPFYLKKPNISAIFDYYNLHDISMHDRFLGSNCDTSLMILPPLRLNAGEERFFAFSFVLPDDFKRFRGNLNVGCSDLGVDDICDIRSSYGIAVSKALSPLQKVIYTDLGMVSLE